ncbi:MAG: YegS/Rv2252/BmrU family lipid kinase, partial [Proteobacteria bacterium]
DHHIIKLSDEERDIDPNVLIEKYKSEIDYVVIGGGDGSVNKALPSLVKSQIPLLVLPLGTANNLARTYELTAKIEELLYLVDHGVTISVDLGTVNGIYFVNVAGMGLSSKVNRQVPHWFKRYFGVFAFIVTAFQVLRKARPFKAVITADGKSVKSLSWQISVCNGKHYGSGFTIKDTATLTDEKLHCLSTEITNWWTSALLIPKFFKGKYDRSDDVTLVAGKKITITTKHPLKIDVDGDVQTTTPAEFDVIPRILKLVIHPEVNAKN